jgi:hypothetical protein
MAGEAGRRGLARHRADLRRIAHHHHAIDGRAISVNRGGMAAIDAKGVKRILDVWPPDVA